VSQVHPKEKLLEEAYKTAQKIAQFSQIAVAFGKRAINSSQEVGVTQGNEHERSLFIGLMSTNDKREGITAFLEKRKPKFTHS
jgi:enoyl-CoA hydratase/carnithine racemase